MHEHLKFKLTDAERDDVYRVIGKLPFIDHWRSDVTTNKILQEVYDYKKQSHRYELGNVQNLSPAALLLKKGRLFADYLRNRKAHRMDKFKSLGPYAAQGTELVTYIRWPIVNAVVQYELYIRKAKGDLNSGEIY